MKTFDRKAYQDRSEFKIGHGSTIKGRHKERSERILLGLELSRRHCKPGTPVTLAHISAFTGTTMQSIDYIEKTAIKKLKAKLVKSEDPILLEVLSLFL